MIKTMTIRRGKENQKTPVSASRGITADPRANFLIENMTARNARILQDFKKGRRHPPTCVCWLCLWRIFEKKRPAGRPYDYLTFLSRDIVSEAEDAFQFDSIEKIPIKVLAKEVIRRLPIIHPETKRVLNSYTKNLFKAHFIEYSKRGRYKTDHLENLVEQLMYQIHRKAGRNPPRPDGAGRPLMPNWDKRPARIPSPLKIAKFVYSQPGRKATQRQLQRYTNKRKADLEKLHEWLKWRYGIVVPQHQNWESTLYVGTKKKFPLKGPAPRPIKSLDELTPDWMKTDPAK